MAALTADRVVPDIKNDMPGIILDMAVEASETMYAGAFAQEGTSGIQALAASTTLPCVGIVLKQVAEGATAGTTLCPVVSRCVFTHAVGSSTTANIGDRVYASDDQTLTLTSTSNSLVGVILNVPVAGTCVIEHQMVER